MRKQDILVLAIAGIAGVITFLFVVNYLKQARPKYQFVIASRAIEKDMVIKAEDLRMSEPIASDQPLSPEQLSDLYTQLPDVVGMQALEVIPQGNVINRSKVKKSDISEKASELPVPPGKRVFNLSPNEIENLSQDITSGTFIDVIGNVATFDGKMELQPIVRDVQVRSIFTDEKTGELKSITIILSPRATDAVAKAVKRGRIRLVVRSEGTGKEDIVSEYIGYIEIIKGVFKEKVSHNQSSYYEEKSVIDKTMLFGNE